MLLAAYEYTPWSEHALNDCRRRLRHGLPEFAVVAEEDASAPGLQRREALQGAMHLRAVVDAQRQAPLCERAAEIAGIGGEHDVAAGQAQLQRLMTGRMAEGRQQHDAAVAEEVVLAIDQLQLVAKIVVAPIEAARRGNLRILSRRPFLPLHHDGGVGDRGVAADMIEMEMRVDDEIDRLGIAAEGAQPRRDVLARMIIEAEEPGDALPTRPLGSCWQSGWMPVSKSAVPLGCSMR